MRTLVYCTAYGATELVWRLRYRRWLDAVLAGLNADQVLLVDDGSPLLPGWPELQLYSGDVLGEAFTVGPRGRVLMFHFREHLGRASLHDFAGWHRSYVFGALYAEANGFDRVIHLESDAFLISERARRFVSDAVDGWVAPWSAHYNMPELAISVAAGDGLRRLAAFARQPYAALLGQVHELAVPFTGLNRDLVGDRYAETDKPVPDDADYAAQVPWRREDGFDWWLPGRQRRGAPRHAVTLQLGKGGNGETAAETGWGVPENGFRWMVGPESVLRLPALPGEGDGVLRLGVSPCLIPGRQTSQRLIVNVSGQPVAEFDIGQRTVVGCDVPRALLRQSEPTLVRLIHPDAVSPSVWGTGNRDTRRLALNVAWVTLERW